MQICKDITIYEMFAIKRKNLEGEKRSVRTATDIDDL